MQLFFLLIGENTLRGPFRLLHLPYFRTMQKIKDIQSKELVSGVVGHYLHGTDATFGYVELKQGSRVPDHSHPNEQITYILDGQLQMVIGGEEFLLEAGMCHIIKSDVVHSAFAATDCKLIDVFTPVREDYK